MSSLMLINVDLLQDIHVIFEVTDDSQVKASVSGI